MPDLIALSRSLYALSQNKNDPNTNAEIRSRSRKNIFVDISWVTAKRDFFRPFILSKFCYKHSQNCSGVIRNDQNMTPQPRPAVGRRGGSCPTPAAGTAATSATIPGWRPPCFPPSVHAFARAEGTSGMHGIKEANPTLNPPHGLHLLLRGKSKCAARGGFELCTLRLVFRQPCIFLCWKHS